MPTVNVAEINAAVQIRSLLETQLSHSRLAADQAYLYVCDALTWLTPLLDRTKKVADKGHIETAMMELRKAKDALALEREKREYITPDLALGFLNDLAAQDTVKIPLEGQG